MESTIKILLKEYKRPWKLVLLSLGLVLLIVGSFYYDVPDWDIPISIIMALLTYVTAPWCMRVILNFKWKHFPLMIFLTWLSVDGSYWVYWKFKNPIVLPMLRDANFFASLPLYGICGLVWYYRGSLKDLFHETRQCIKSDLNLGR